MSSRRPAILVSAIGVASVALYAALAAVQILALNPLAAVPGRTLSEIRGDMSDAGETMNVGMVLGILLVGVGIALVVAAIVIRIAAPARFAALLFLIVLALGTPAYFMASFGPGMSLADTYGIGGADHSPWALPLYAVSLLAFGAVTGLVVTTARTQSRLGTDRASALG